MSRSSFGAPNHTQTPNSLFDLLPDMDETELRVTLVIIRETFGWHRPSVELTLTQLQQRTGLSKQGVWNGLEKGQERGTIVKTAEGRRRAFALNVSAADDGQLSRPINSVDRPAVSESQLSRPNENGTVNSVDRKGQLSRPSTVNSVDRTDPSGAAPSSDKTEAERKTKESKRKETETGTPLPVSAEGQDEDPITGAADAARGDTEATLPLQDSSRPTANGRAPNATSSKDVPPAAAPVESPVDNFPDTALRPLLVGCFGQKWLGDLIEEDPSRTDWFVLPTDTFQTQKDDAVTSSARGRWKSTLIGLLDAETARARRARRPAAPGTAPARSLGDEIKARIAATRRTE